MKITRRTKLLVVALALCFTTMIGSTFAWFTDSVESKGNIITTGNLEVAMHWANGTTAPDTTTWTDASAGAIFNYNLWEPGYVEVRHVKIANTGSLALKYDLKLVPTGEVSDLADVIDVYYFDPAQQLTSRTQLTSDKKIGTLADFIKTNDTSDNTAAGVLKAGESHTVTIALMMQTTAGNDYQNLSIGTDFKLVLNATQATVESDSFGSDYDADAEYDVAIVHNAAEFMAAVKAGKNMVLANDIALTEAVAVNYAANIDLNGYELTVSRFSATSMIKIKDGTMKHGTASNIPAIIIDGGTTTLENVNVNCSTYFAAGDNYTEYVGVQVASGKLTMNNCNITVSIDMEHDQNYVNGIGMHGGEVVMNGGSITLSNPNNYGLVQEAVIFAGGSENKTITMTNVNTSASQIAKYLYAWGGHTTLNTTDSVTAEDVNAQNGSFTIQIIE